MNADQQANIDKAVRAIAETLFSAWSYFHLLQGFHEGSKANPVVIQKFDRLFDQVWRAVFDGLFAKAATVIDRTKGTYSLPNLVTMSRRYGEAELKLLAKQVEGRLTAKDGPLVKIESWRKHCVAHHTRDGKEAGFYIRNKMNLVEVREGLEQLEELLNTISLKVHGVHNDTETGSEDLIQQGAELFACLARHESVHTDLSTNCGS